MSSNYWPYYKFPLWSKYSSTKSVWMPLRRLRQSEKTYDGSDFTVRWCYVRHTAWLVIASVGKKHHIKRCAQVMWTPFFTTRTTTYPLVLFCLRYTCLATQQEGAPIWTILQCFSEFHVCLRNKLKLSTLQMMNSSNSNSLVVNWGYSWSLSSL